MEQCPWLTDMERRAFLLRYKRGWPIEEVAAKMIVSRRTVDRLLHSVRKKSGVTLA